ncbi:hypothetical protein ACT29H_04200 [Thermophagus sp. OGC60D27]|uniref:hypothetical protein n=1 Tax=Thermophagus sp. OGC60D27 TaxID=3458415 RepID=UPI004037CC1F
MDRPLPNRLRAAPGASPTASIPLNIPEEQVKISPDFLQHPKAAITSAAMHPHTVISRLRSLQTDLKLTKSQLPR